MSKQEIVEALARELCAAVLVRLGQMPTAQAVQRRWRDYVADVERMLGAAEGMRPGFSSLLEGSGVVVPVEPTEAMAQAGCCVPHDGREHLVADMPVVGGALAVAVWRAMVLASQEGSAPE